jgi:hypothetical protein
LAAEYRLDTAQSSAAKAIAMRKRRTRSNQPPFGTADIFRRS